LRLDTLDVLLALGIILGVVMLLAVQSPTAIPASLLAVLADPSTGELRFTGVHAWVITIACVIILVLKNRDAFT
jgi:hypothetical protein